MKIAIIGCGLIGRKRAEAVKNHQITLCVDVIEERAKNLANTLNNNCRFNTDWRAALSADVDLVIIATLHDQLAKIAIECARAKKHILIEKPGAKHSSELKSLKKVAASSGSLIHIGFNHRFHRALQKAKEMISSGALGELMFIRGRYGHGGRLGYEKEWRAQPDLSGGGELLDQGVHLIDLSRWFLGNFVSVQGHAHTYYWDMPVDDNAFLLLKNAKQQTAFLHVSWTEWKNIFSFEIYGRKGKIEVNGLGGSYGIEKITFYKMLEEMGPPETYSWEYPMKDNSWEIELKQFMDDIEQGKQPSPNIDDAIAALTTVEEIYRISAYDYCT